MKIVKNPMQACFCRLKAKGDGRMKNYARELDMELERIRAAGLRPRLLLHACCAPCSSYTLEYLAEYFDITLFFYNPNISPEREYMHRAAELARLVRSASFAQDVRLLTAEYDAAPFFEMARGLEAEAEGGARCKKCYHLRLKETARAAANARFDYFCTTLSISPYKDAGTLNEIGGELAEQYGVRYLFSDFKKKGGYQRSIALSKEYHLYRQNYCGCVYSKSAAERRAHEQHS